MALDPNNRATGESAHQRMPDLEDAGCEMSILDYVV